MHYFCLNFRARLSLNLNLPTSDETDSWPYNKVNNGVLTSPTPRHSDYPLFCSQREGTQGFDESVCEDKNKINIDHNSPENTSNKNEINVPLMRVSSLPTITPPAPSIGKSNKE